jgi:hypothetical protein
MSAKLFQELNQLWNTLHLNFELCVRTVFVFRENKHFPLLPYGI